MTSKKERILWSLAAGSAAVVAGLTTQAALKAGWRKTRGSEPPDNPDSSEVAWRDALAWTAMTGATIGIARLVATRLTASGWKKIYHSKPPQEN